MRKINYIILVLLLNSSGLRAQDITGLWKGTLYNDTTQQYYRYEIAISEEGGKLSGYSHTWFILDDKQYYGVKKVRISRQDGKVIVEDNGLIANNYPVPPNKNVRQLGILTLEINDSVMILSGPYSTNRTKAFHSLTGNVNVQRKSDFRQSALVPHLEELGRAKELSFVMEEEKQIAKREADEKERLALSVKQKEASLAMETQAAIEKDKIKAALKQEEEDARTLVLNKKTGYDPAKKERVLVIENGNITQPKTKSSPLPEIKVKDTVALAKDIVTTVAKTNTVAIIVAGPADDVAMRKTELQQTVYFRSDSLQLSLYDNGEVDGDTVSVLMNGKVIMARERLSTTAIRKTIMIDPSQDSVQLIMYAENLGTIAPNTGLLVVKDGKDIYEIRFSGDLKKNAAIVFKRREK